MEMCCPSCCAASSDSLDVFFLSQGIYIVKKDWLSFLRWAFIVIHQPNGIACASHGLQRSRAEHKNHLLLTSPDCMQQQNMTNVPMSRTKHCIYIFNLQIKKQKKTHSRSKITFHPRSTRYSTWLDGETRHVNDLSWKDQPIAYSL